MFVLLAAILVAGPAQPSPQPWADAYQAGQYEKAADLLYPVVVELAQQLIQWDPEPFHALATLYERGLGVQRDPIAACALANMAMGATHMIAPRYAQDVVTYKAVVDAAESFQRDLCVVLSPEDGIAAGRAMGCFAFGMPEGSVQLGPHMVRFGRAGIALATRPVQEPGNLLNCPVVVVRVRAFTLEAPDNAAPDVKPRHLLEMLSWIGGTPAGGGSPRYALMWEVHEIQKGQLEVVAMEQLATRESWPARDLPADLASRLHLEIIRSGHVRWRFDDNPPRRGWIMLPDEDRR
ncbi:MAG TPA: hypothetical protein VD833_15860 [Vicinamibacterales bacterium]|nr:hypothetical protein [Vicinamibacterales bacterium]